MADRVNDPAIDSFIIGMIRLGEISWRKIATLQNKIKGLENELNELNYRPDGDGAKKAKEDFMSLISKIN